MCGIAGIWNFDGQPVSDDAIIRFTDTLKHRGPDGRGIWHNTKRNLAFGHRRLAIIDLSHDADQPFHFADNRYHMVYNGEIYNFIEIRNELILRGYTFRTDSDTEVIMAAYHAWGAEMQFKFNGMWALVIYDEQEQTCFISRDRFGIKPFMYYLDEKRFAFASELKSFRKLENFSVSMHKNAAIQFLKTGFGVEGSAETMLEGIRKLKAGHCGIIRNGKARIYRWWNTLEHLQEVPTDFNEQAEQFRALFYDAVKLRMRSDVSVGSCLSGGFDSSAVVSALAEIGKAHQDTRMSPDWQQTFVATFPGKSNDERPQAEEVVAYTGVKGHFFEVREEESFAVFDQVLQDFDDVYVGIPVAPWLIYRELRRNNVVVSLDGHGADELMGAYMHPAGAYLANAPSLLGNWEKNNQLLNDSLKLKHVNKTPSNKLNQLFHYHPDFEPARNTFKAAKQLKDRFMRSTSSEYLMPGMLDQGWNEGLTSHSDSLDETNRNLYRMFHEDVLPTILRNFDRMSMAHGIEVRMPFMDWRLVTYAFSLPGSSKIQDGYTKRIAREAMKGRMPESIRSSKVKIGFNAPMPEWFNGPLNPWIQEVLRDYPHHEWIDMVQLRKDIERHTQLGDWNWSSAGNTWKYLHYLWFEKNLKGHD
ncbi:MAG: asparagine synthase (glutamine-hydrolyzing) [Bacteroidia bacterium]|jgi:asparagine synthase (glutamine-hydrolysing)